MPPSGVLPRFLAEVPSAEAAVQRLLAWLESLPRDLSRQGTVLVPAERVAHALRRRVCGIEARPGLLAGVRLLAPLGLAVEVLARAGQPVRPGGAAVRRLRILELFQAATLPLQYFRTEQLRAGRGYVEAFVRAIADLEDSGLDPDGARRAADGLAGVDPLGANRLRDVACVWAAADEVVARKTDGRVLHLAAEVAERRPDLLAAFAPLSALLVSEPTGSLLRFLAALPDCRVVFIDALPLRAGTQRWRRAAGPGPAAAVRAGETDRGAGSADDHAAGEAACRDELRLLQRRLFAPPRALGGPHGAGVAGPDGSVEIEQYASVEDEVEAAAEWVAEQVHGGAALGEIALIVPEVDPYARLLLDRLSRIGQAGGANARAGSEIAGYVAGGLALADAPAGVRLLALLRAWRRALDAEATVRILPALRRDAPEEALRLTPSRCAELVYGAGIVGGSPGDPAGASEWLPRLQRRRESLERIVAEGEPGAVEEPEKRRHRWDRHKAQEWLADLVPMLPALAALQEVAQRVVGGVSLAQLWPAVRAFVRDWYRLPPDPPDLMALLNERLAPVLGDRAAQQVSGSSALDYLIETLQRERRRMGRYGEPRVFIGTAAAAAGLPFRAVRVLGLAEGALPRTPHDDPIVPNDLRRLAEEALCGAGVVPRIEDRVLEDLHAFFRVVAATVDRLALSAPRHWVDRSEREVSGVLLEAAAALGRLPADAGENQASIADRLQAAYFTPARSAREAFAGAALPLPRSAALRLPARHADGLLVPEGWLREAATAVDRVRELGAALEAGGLGEIDGALGSVRGAVALPGLSPERPISASALATLLSCPHRFLLERVLGLSEPAARPSTDAIEPLAYGSLFHAAAEAIYREAGSALCQRSGTLAHWVSRAREVAAAQFDLLRDEYPLRGADAIERERERLLRQIEQLIRHEWTTPPRVFVDTERRFGVPEPVRVELGCGSLYVRGAVDRIDRGDAGLSVRDLKTGPVPDFAEEPINPGRDLQLGLYTLVLEADAVLAGRVAHAAYVHPSELREPERAFRGAGVTVLRERAAEWLTVAGGLLQAGLFSRTPDPEDCRFCPFVAACGEGAQARSARKLRAGPVPAPLAGLLATKSARRADDR